MSRAIHPDVIAELAKDQFLMAHLVVINFDEPVHITDHDHALTYGGQTYEAGGHLLGMSPVNESSELRVGSFQLNLSGVDQAYISLLLSQQVTNRRVFIQRVILFSDTQAQRLTRENGDLLTTEAGDYLMTDTGTGIIGDPIMLYDGRISDFTLADDTTTSTIQLRITSHWSDFEKRAGRRTNHASQQAFFPSDQFFQYTAQSVKNIKWGRA